MRLRISVVVSWRLGTGREGPLSDELDSVMAHCTYLLTTYRVYQLFIYVLVCGFLNNLPPDGAIMT